MELWGLWVASLGEGEAARKFLKKDKFLVGLCEPLCKKVRGKFPASYVEAVKIAKRKKKKLYLHSNPDSSLLDHEGCPQHYPKEQWWPPLAPAPQGAVQQRGGSQQEVLKRITNQLENLSANLVVGGDKNGNHKRGNRRQQRLSWFATIAMKMGMVCTIAPIQEYIQEMETLEEGDSNKYPHLKHDHKRHSSHNRHPH